MVPATLVNVLVDPGASPGRARPGGRQPVTFALGAIVATVAILAGVPVLVFAAVAAAAAANALVRPATMALVPAVARTPEELVSAT